jgi:DME family drug/metabolite transporter
MKAIQRGRLQVIGAAVCWSVVGAGVKYASPPLDGWQIAGGRSLFAFLFLCALLRPWRGAWRPGLKVALLALTYAVMLVLFILSNTLTFSANAIFLQDSALVWILLFSPLVLKEPFRPRDLAVFVLCVPAMALLFKDQLRPGQTTGNVLALLSGVGYAIVLMGMRWGRRRKDAAAVPAASVSSESPTPGGGPHALTDAEGMMLWGNLLCFLLCVPKMGALPEHGVVLPLAVVALLGVVQLGLGYYLISLGMTHVPAMEGSLLTLIEPVLNPLWACLLVGEVPGRWTLCGGAVIIACVAWQALARSAPRPVDAAPVPDGLAQSDT